MRLHHAAVMSSSKEKADRFYGDVLGLKTIKTKTLGAELIEQIFGRPRSCELILFGNDQMAIEVFVSETVPERQGLLAHLCLEVEARDAFLEKCEATGVAVKKIASGDAWVVFVADFDGNLFEVKELPS